MKTVTQNKTYILPNFIKGATESDPLTSMLYITDCGYYHKAVNHYKSREVGANEHILIYCIDGKGWYSLKDGAKNNITKGKFFIIKNNTPHKYAANEDDPWSIYWIHFKGEKAHLFSELFNKHSEIYSSEYERLKVRIDVFEEIMANFENGYDVSTVQYSTLCLWYLLGSFKFIEHFREINKVKRSNPIEVVITYMNNNISENLTLEDFAQISGYSTSHFGVLFQNAIEKTPIEYFNTLKIKSACESLRLTQQSVKEIAFSLGYSNQYYFCRIFKKITGLTPTQYRSYDVG